MADPQAATLTQLHNIQRKTGKKTAQLHAVLAAGGMCQYTVRIFWPAEIDEQLLDWIEAAYAGAG